MGGSATCPSFSSPFPPLSPTFLGTPTFSTSSLSLVPRLRALGRPGLQLPHLGGPTACPGRGSVNV